MAKQNLQDEWEFLLSIKNTIFGLNKENIDQSIKSIFSNFDGDYPLSFNMLIYQIVYSLFMANPKDSDMYLNFLQKVKAFEENKQIQANILNEFQDFLQKKNTQESYYLLIQMIENNLIDAKIENIKNPFLEKNNIHGFDDPYCRFFLNDIGESNADNLWEIHKKLIKEGVNPNEIAKIIRDDNLEKLQEISSQSKFNFKQKIQPSPYERCSFINETNASLIDYAAFFGAIKCFKYLLLNGAKVSDTGKYAVAGGNEEIIHLCEQNHSVFQRSYSNAIIYHRNDVFKYIYENQLESNPKIVFLTQLCIVYHNYEIFTFLKEKGMKLNQEIVNEAPRVGNIFLTKYFLKTEKIPKNILPYAAESKNIELVKYILDQKGIDVNAKNIYFLYLIFILIIMDFKIIFGNCLIYFILHLHFHLK